MSRKGLEPSRLLSSHFECDAFTNFAIYSIINIINLLNNNTISFINFYTNMNFLNFSLSYEYLYSPTSWLHKQNDKLKILIFLLQLTFLPFIATKYLPIFFILFIYLYSSTYISNHLKSYLNTIIILFLFFY